MKVEEYLATKNVEFDLIPHHDTYGAQRMAEALHVSGKVVAKTVLLRANHAFKYVVAVLPADKSIDFERASKSLGGSHLELATEEEIAEHCPDCEVGALPPFGSQYDMETIVDESLAGDDEIVFEGNTHHESIRLKFRDFCDIESPLVASFAR